MKRRGFLQAIFGAAAVPAAVKAAEVMPDNVYKLPSPKRPTQPRPMTALVYDGYATASCFTAFSLGTPTSAFVADARCRYCGRLHDKLIGNCESCGAPL